MSLTSRWALVALTLALAGPILARGPNDQERPELHTPVVAVTRGELERREAARVYGLALFHEKNNRLLEALRGYEEAKRARS